MSPVIVLLVLSAHSIFAFKVLSSPGDVRVDAGTEAVVAWQLDEIDAGLILALVHDGRGRILKYAFNKIDVDDQDYEAVEEGQYGFSLKNAGLQHAGEYSINQDENSEKAVLVVQAAPTTPLMTQNQTHISCFAESNTLPTSYRQGMTYAWRITNARGVVTSDVDETYGLAVMSLDQLPEGVRVSCQASEAGSDLVSDWSDDDVLPGKPATPGNPGDGDVDATGLVLTTHIYPRETKAGFFDNSLYLALIIGGASVLILALVIIGLVLAIRKKRQKEHEASVRFRKVSITEKHSDAYQRYSQPTCDSIPENSANFRFYISQDGGAAWGAELELAEEQRGQTPDVCRHAK